MLGHGEGVLVGVLEGDRFPFHFHSIHNVAVPRSQRQRDFRVGGNGVRRRRGDLAASARRDLHIIAGGFVFFEHSDDLDVMISKGDVELVLDGHLLGYAVHGQRSQRPAFGGLNVDDRLITAIIQILLRIGSDRALAVDRFNQLVAAFSLCEGGQGHGQNHDQDHKGRDQSFCSH